MGGIIKFVLFMFLVMAFFTLPEGGNALTCFRCDSEKIKQKDCLEGGKDKYKFTCGTVEDTCLTTFTWEVGEITFVWRSCIGKLDPDVIGVEMGKCGPEKNGVDLAKIKHCICDKNDCNSGTKPDPPFAGDTMTTPSSTTTTPSSTNSMYLTGWTMFQLLTISFGVIIPCFTQ